MSGFDIVLAAIILIATGISAFRGFGRAVFDCLGLYLALIIAHCAYLPLSGAVHFHSGAADNHAAAYMIVFVLSSIIMLCLSRFVYGTVLYNAGVFDQLLGVAVLIAVIMWRVMQTLAKAGKEIARSERKSTIACQRPIIPT